MIDEEKDRMRVELEKEEWEEGDHGDGEGPEGNGPNRRTQEDCIV